MNNGYEGGLHEELGFEPWKLQELSHKNWDRINRHTGNEVIMILWVNIAAFDRKCWFTGFTGILQLMAKELETNII